VWVQALVDLEVRTGSLDSKVLPTPSDAPQ